MNYLLDTHTFLWFIYDNPRISKKSLSILRNPRNDIYLSSTVAWEIAIKENIGKIEIHTSLNDLITQSLETYNFITLPVSLAHAIKVGTLPSIHRDPFDRILVAQAMVENLTILTSDPFIKKYKVKTAW